MTQDSLLEEFDDALAALAQAKEPARAPHRQKIVDLAVALVGQGEEGLLALAKRASRLQDGGFFANTAWAEPSRLLPKLVRGGLLGSGNGPTIELLSELRVLAIASGELTFDDMTRQEAVEFLSAVVVQNLQFLGTSNSEDERNRPETYARARLLIDLLMNRLSPEFILEHLVDEIDALCHQRPILTERTHELITRASLLGASEGSPPEIVARLARYQAAIGHPSPLSQRAQSRPAYRDALKALSERELADEAVHLASAMRDTGLCNPYHAILLRHLAAQESPLLAKALGLNGLGAASLSDNLASVCELIQHAIFPSTCQSIYGLAGLLERALLTRRAVLLGLQRLHDVQLHPLVIRALLADAGANSQVSANSRLLAGAISVLGQPLGIGQGSNPTCQSARALSLWSTHAAGYLLHLLIATARDGSLVFDFEGAPLESSTLAAGLTESVTGSLDPVSTVLVPHLDRVYNEMMRRATGRGEDPHRWVNPSFYGRWVPSGMACAINVLTQAVQNYENFVRLFFGTHHPAFNDGDDLIYPNPVGIFVTNAHGRMLGAHAVSLRRVEPDPKGQVRAYFFNPNNEGRQDWGHGVVTSIAGCGEVPGESSLPFGQFASRLYAFHHHPHLGSALEAVPDATIEAVKLAARQSWGKGLPWV